MTDENGEQTNALYGLAKALCRIRRVLPSEYAIAVFDAGAPLADGGPAQHNVHEKLARRAMFPGYKLGRRSLERALERQLQQAPQLCRSVGLTTHMARKGAEADDVIASCVDKARARGLPSVVLSVDKDLLQLVTDTHPATCWAKPGHLEELWGERKVREAFGVAPALIGDLLALAGDASDGVPSVPGIGRVLAARLLDKYGNLQGVLDAAESRARGDVKGVGTKKWEALRRHAEDARLNRKLVSLRADLDSSPSVEAMRWDTSEADFRAALVKQGFQSFGKSLRRDDGEDRL